MSRRRSRCVCLRCRGGIARGGSRLPCCLLVSCEMWGTEKREKYPWISTPSKPAVMQRFAASANSLVTEWISSTVMGRGGLAEYSVPSRALPLMGISDELIAWVPSMSDGAVPLPTCQSWQMIKPPFAWTASVMRFHPASWPSVKTPGTPG